MPSSLACPARTGYWNEQLPRLEDCLKRAISRYGCPLAIYADQGSVYRADQLDTACATLGIQRILARPYSPEAKGKIERFFGFVRSDFLPELARCPSVQSLDDLPGLTARAGRSSVAHAALR